jgi:hypothetical protein
MSTNQNVNVNLTRSEILRVIGDHATFAKKEKLERMVLSKREEYLMIGLRVYIVAILVIILFYVTGLL